METELQATFNQLPKDPLPADHAIYQPIKEFTYREYAKVRLGQLKTPRLRTIDVNGRAAVFFSAEDLSAGLVGHGVDGITGYTPATATAIMTNLVLQGAP